MEYMAKIIMQYYANNINNIYQSFHLCFLSSYDGLFHASLKQIYYEKLLGTDCMDRVDSS